MDTGQRKSNYIVWICTTAMLFCLFGGGAKLAHAAQKDGFPNKTIKVIVPQSPGGSTDMEPRFFLPHLGKRLGVDMVIENVPGADGKMGLTKGWKAAADGYTLIYHGLPQSIMTEWIYKAEFQTRSFTYLLGLYSTNTLLWVHADAWKTMEEFLKTAKNKPLSGAVASRGSTGHINGMIMAEKLGIEANWVPFNSAAEVLANLAGKHVDFALVSAQTAQPMAAAGKIRPLLVYADAPEPIFPDVPFPRKLGYEMSHVSAIRGFIAPPHLPAARAKILEDAMTKTAKDPAYADWATKRKMEITLLGSAKYLNETKNQYVILEKYRKFFLNP